MVFRESTERSLDERSFGREKRGIIVRYVCTVHKIILGSLIDPKARTAQFNSIAVTVKMMAQCNW